LMIKAVVFDFDGLIVDTEVPVYQSWARVYTDHEVALDLAFWQTIIGTDGFDPAAALEGHVGRRLDWAVIDERRRRHRDELQALEGVRPGVMEWLHDARRFGLNVGIASSSPRAWVVGHLRRLGLADHFQCLRCRDDVGAAKPDPASYLAVLDHFGVDADEAIALEDSVHGVAAAKAAGMWCVAVPNPLMRGLDFSAADVVVDSLGDLSLTGAADRFGPIDVGGS
jgi:HAD superfamily hydrolase (TIGR01509 family)